MILADLRDYLQASPGATLAELAGHFGTDGEALRGMLALWVRKGKVEKILPSSGCGSGCTQCPLPSVEMYRWKGDFQASVPQGPTRCPG